MQFSGESTVPVLVSVPENDSGRFRFPVRFLRFAGAVRAVSGFRFRRFLWGKGSSVFLCSFQGTVPVLVPVPEKRFRRFRFPVPVLGQN